MVSLQQLLQGEQKKQGMLGWKSERRVPGTEGWGEHILHSNLRCDLYLVKYEATSLSTDLDFLLEFFDALFAFHNSDAQYLTNQNHKY